MFQTAFLIYLSLAIFFFLLFKRLANSRDFGPVQTPVPGVIPQWIGLAIFASLWPLVLVGILMAWPSQRLAKRGRIDNESE